jgi:hypothetical protein
MLRSQTVSVPENAEILIPWRIVTDSLEKRAELFSAELSSELFSKHALYGLIARAVAARIDRDDVLFEIEGGDMPLAVVHLTWRKESAPRCLQQDSSPVGNNGSVTKCFPHIRNTTLPEGF